MGSSTRHGLLVYGTVALLLPVTSTALADEAADRSEPVADRAVREAFEDQPREALEDQVNTANNPLADMIAFSLHNYYFPKLNGIPDESANTFWLRFVTPFWRVIPRVSLPIQVVPAPNPTASVAKVTGIGDLNVFATFVVTPPDRGRGAGASALRWRGTCRSRCTDTANRIPLFVTCTMPRELGASSAVTTDPRSRLQTLNPATISSRETSG